MLQNTYSPPGVSKIVLKHRIKSVFVYKAITLLLNRVSKDQKGTKEYQILKYNTVINIEIKIVSKAYQASTNACNYNVIIPDLNIIYC